MTTLPLSVQFLAAWIATWIARHQERTIDYLKEENRVLREKLGGRVRLTDPERDEKWLYSLGHWVEADPDQSDGAFSSPGAFGFYPWIDSQRRFYGLVARADLLNAGSNDLTKISSIASVRCGRLIRRAWLNGQ